MNKKLEIILNEVNNKKVSLKNLSLEAMESFTTVISSLKSLAISISADEDFKFSIMEGSAAFLVEASDKTMDLIYNEIDIAIKGETDDRYIASFVRKIQENVKRDNFAYQFYYNSLKTKEKVNIHKRLINAPKIAVRRKKQPFTCKLKVLYGFLYQIGGKSPNYHFENLGDGKITISCTEDEAISINKYLYKDVESLLLVKKWDDIDKNEVYIHKKILNDETSIFLKEHLKKYNKEKDLVRKLTLIYDLIDDAFKNSDIGYNVLSALLIGFNNENFHLSELKTLLVISKSFKKHATIKKLRNTLLETYNKKKLEHKADA